MITALAVACRPHGAPAWDAAGVMAEIGKVKQRTLADVILAVIRAADDRTARTPGVISAPGSTHWQERGTRTPAREPFDRGGCCSTCSLPRDKCRQVWGDDHPFISVHEYAKTVNHDPAAVARIVEAVKAETALMREPAQLAANVVTERDHVDCETAITSALNAGNDGKAEFLAERCDRTHGPQLADQEPA